MSVPALPASPAAPPEASGARALSRPDPPDTPAPAPRAPASAAPLPPNAALRRYYEASTRRFLALGGSGASLAIHRGLWAPGIDNAEAAADHINRLIVGRVRGLGIAAPGRVRDLGCGVGGSLLHFARAWPAAQLEGVTLSSAQATMGREFAADRGLAGRLDIACGDFLAPPADPVDLAVAIESHVHAPAAADFLAAARLHLRPGGHLVLVDDMLARPEARMTEREGRLVATIRRGWHLGHLPEAEALKRTARAAGLACLHDEDLTHLIRLNRPRDRAFHLLAPLADLAGLGRWPLWSNMIGGNALTLGYRRGLLRYRLMVFVAA